MRRFQRAHITPPPGRSYSSSVTNVTRGLAGDGVAAPMSVRSPPARRGVIGFLPNRLAMLRAAFGTSGDGRRFSAAPPSRVRSTGMWLRVGLAPTDGLQMPPRLGTGDGRTAGDVLSAVCGVPVFKEDGVKPVATRRNTVSGTPSSSDPLRMRAATS